VVVPVALLLVAALAGSGYVLLREPEDGSAGANGSGTTPAAPRTTPSTSSGKDAGKGAPRPRVQTLAPRQAGPVSAVELVKAGECRPGALCAVTVTARFSPASTARLVTWRVGTARSCTSDVTWSPPVTVTAQPGWTSVYASSSVAVPAGRPLAIVALTSAPARAQSAPVPVTGSLPLRC
jgi:hypothetical protein